MNLTWTFAEEIGSRAAATGSSCIRSLELNESDFSATGALQGFYGELVTEWGVQFKDSTLIGSVYDSGSESKAATQVLDFLSAYSDDHWFLTLISLFALVLLLLVCKITAIRKPLTLKRITRRATRVALFTVACIVKQHTSCSCVKLTRPLSHWIYLGLTMHTFFSGYFLTSMIKTEAVVVKPPATYDSYADLLAHDVLPIWVREMDDQRTFRDAKPGTNEREIWMQAEERGINRSLLSLKEVGGDLSLVVPRLMAVANRSAVGLSNWISTNVAVSNGCAFSREQQLYTQVMAYVRQDPDAVEVLRVVLGSAVAAPSLRRRVTRTYARLFESHLLMPTMLRSLSFSVAKPTGHASEVQECMANVIVMPDHTFLTVPVPHFFDLLTVCTYLVALAAFLLLTERLF